MPHPPPMPTAMLIWIIYNFLDKQKYLQNRNVELKLKQAQRKIYQTEIKTGIILKDAQKDVAEQSRYVEKLYGDCLFLNGII